MRRWWGGLLGATLVCGAVVVSPPASAAQHLMKIVEVFGGTAAQPDAQFIELKMFSNGQNFVGGHDVDVFNSAGTLVTNFTFLSNMANGENQDSILVATDDAATLFDITPDLSMTSAPIDPAGGKVCFETFDCVSWGNYSASRTTPSPTGKPEPIMCNSLVRSLGSNGTLEDADDTNDSETDFESGVPSPRNNAGEVGISSIETCFSFVRPFVYTVSESSPGPTPVTISVGRMDTSMAATVEYVVNDGSATGGSDYEIPSPNPGTVSFDTGDMVETFDVNILDDDEMESTETLTVTLQNPSAGSVRGPGITVNILDDDSPPDVEKPVSRIKKPAQGSSHARGSFTKFRGTATDSGGSLLKRVQVALRVTLDNGKCRWFTGARFVAGACGTKQRWRNATGTDSWSLPLGSFRLPKTRPKDPFAFYTVFSRGRDFAGNVESRFTKRRNANRFEIT